MPNSITWPDSITRRGWEVNIKSMQEEEFPKMWVGSVINYCRPNWEVTASNLEPSYVVSSCLYQFQDFVLKWPGTTVRNGFWLLILSNENCKLSPNSPKESEDWLGDRYKEIKLHNFPPSKISKIKHFVDNGHQLVSKQVNFYNTHTLTLSYY